MQSSLGNTNMTKAPTILWKTSQLLRLYLVPEKFGEKCEEKKIERKSKRKEKVKENKK